MATRKIPKFQSEQEEADWWHQNRAELDQEFLQAAQEGQLRRLGREQLAARVASTTRVISLRLAEEDLALAREQAAHTRIALPDLSEIVAT